MRRVVLLSLLLLLTPVNSQADDNTGNDEASATEDKTSATEEGDELELVCDVTPEGFEDIDPTTQNKVDEWIQKLSGSRLGGLIRRVIARAIKREDSVIRRMLGRLAQDPNDENFEEGELGITQPVYSPVLSLMTKIYGETKTVVGYLRAFGFFGKVLGMSPNKLENYKGSIPPCAITEAVKAFQLFNNLEPSGTLTKETRDLMKKERCGNPDVGCETPDCIADKEAEEASEYLNRRRRSLNRQKRWEVVSGRTWKSGDFKYFYQGYTDDMTQEVQRAEIERSLKEWADVANVNFYETDTEEESDIRIDFGGGDHGDKYPFSGPGGVLAHGFYPRKGDMHFDDDEFFTANQFSGTNLYYVATHEFGHVLGIRHTNVKGAVMYPYYPGFKEEINLTEDDISAAVTLFGARETETVVDGGWSEYGDWSDCNTVCGGGVQTRTRTCTNPVPGDGGAECTGDGTEMRTCNMVDCVVPIDGRWSDFGAWSECSVECGGGSQTRTKTCSNPPPKNGGEECVGGDSETRNCNTEACPEAVEPVEPGVPGLLPHWEVTQSGTLKTMYASLAVDGDLRTKSQTKCSGKEHAWFKYTLAIASEVETVVIVNGNYDNKRYKLDNAVVYAETGSEWVECGRIAVTSTTSTRGQTYTVDCGGIVATSVKIVQEQKWNKRNCLDLKEVKVYGISGDVEEPDVDEGPPAVDGGWSEYGDWSECSVDCGRGTQTRTKTCTNPVPENGGADCEGSPTQIQPCFGKCIVPLDGGWSDWSNWSECSAECEGGTQSRSKTCTDPVPKNGGADCVGAGSETRNCNTQECPTLPGLDVVQLIPHFEVSQSSTAKSLSASLAVDGDLDTKSQTGCTGKANSWFKYTLAEPHSVGKVEIVNGNNDKKRGKLDKAMVYGEHGFEKFLCGRVQVTEVASTEGQTYSVNCGGRLATSVKIVQKEKWNKRKCLELKEVRVFEYSEELEGEE
ncbi:uncharacterized protein LOC134824699 isoform X2 [Bolinopsis microptera]|uniref:uncharacterized protein LOC134824699 isoform X2 n=1 Tax=Bolinopsis microptera TaxID=2820187 RepID=UPI00307A0CB8